MNAGDTFLIPEPGTSLDSHLWIVLSDPSVDADKVLIVNLTSFRDDKDQSCILLPGDHPFVTKKTCVNYGGIKVVAAADLERLLTAGHMKAHEPFGADVLERIRQSAAKSSHIKYAHRLILIDQGVVDDSSLL